MQCKVKETVHQYRKTAGKGPNCNPVPENVRGICSQKPAPEKHNYKEESQQAPDDSGITQYLKVIIVRLFQSKQAVSRVMMRVSQSKRAQACPNNWMVRNNVQRHTPKVGATCRRVA